MASKMPQDRPKTAPRGSWRATFSLLKIVLKFDAFWVRFGSILAPKSLPKNFGGAPPLLHLESVRFSSYVMHRFKVAQEPAKRPQDPPKSTPRCPKRLPRAPQEAPREPQETPRAGQEGSKISKIAPRGSQKAPKTHKIAEVNESQRPCPKSQNEKRRAGGGDAPWGKAIRRPDRRGGMNGVLDRRLIRE